MDISLAEVHWIAAKIKYTKNFWINLTISYFIPHKSHGLMKLHYRLQLHKCILMIYDKYLKFSKSILQSFKRNQNNMKRKFLPFLEQSWQLVPQSCCCAAYKTYKSHMQWHQHLSLAWHQSHVEVMNYGTRLGRWSMAQILILHSTWYCHHPGKKMVICIRNDSSLKE